MNTDDIIRMACEMAGFNSTPGDSMIHNPGDGIRRVLFGIDITQDDLVRAKNDGLDLVISHHAAAADALDATQPVSDLIDAFRSLPEIVEGDEPLELPVGSCDRPIGRVVVAHGAARALVRHGVGTVVYIHCSDEHRRRLADEDSGNLVVTGHYQSDRLGLNPFVAVLEQRGLEIIRTNRL